MIEKAEWDSNFFGFSVGQINYRPEDNLQEVLSYSKDFKLIYIFSDLELRIPGLTLVDQKTTYSKALAPIEGNEEVKSFDSRLHSYDQLLSLAYLSGIYSRFRRDPRISLSHFQNLYKTWLDNSINKDIAFETLVTVAEGDISGFVTLGNKDNVRSQIGLIAVNEKHQGKHLASKLITECENNSFNKGFSSIEVVTQLENKAACKLYEKKGFTKKSVQLIYHVWNE
ncbi:hypothetical protein GCM10007103_09330 [Salinimicrobium marinum]|uniref:N-acetyltransferase domain-containing protein n=1 Tax=Salinimicrobium marinum TaxID=680283 RepID=A0A918S9H2_9FLAO|nr:GNAT family N-acetyltransferase [Salinimicrobium marinum]GHA30156.1 hypothetical protein GCM10007103_09330 [Salinimicrobium marinum]